MNLGIATLILEQCDLIFNNCGIVIDAITLVKLVGGNGPKVGARQGH
jgi:hypothetical protein